MSDDATLGADDAINAAFGQLARIDTSPPISPPPEFVRRLRGQIEAALAPTVALPERAAPRLADLQENTMTDLARPATTQLIIPYLAVADAAGAIEWYSAVLDGREVVRYTGDDGRVGHAEIDIRGARIYLSDEYPEIGVVAPVPGAGSTQALHLDVVDVDGVFARAVDAGATSQREPADQPHGARNATIVDPFGHRWMLSQTIAEPTIAEINEASDGFTVTEGAAVASGVTVPGAMAPGRPIQLHYFTIFAPDVARAARFYSEVFGWHVDPESGHVDNCDLPFGFQSSEPQPARLWMAVSDAELVIAKVLELGGEVLEDVVYASGRGLVCRDDQGQRFDFYVPAPGYA